jgi:hypothetical protein
MTTVRPVSHAVLHHVVGSSDASDGGPGERLRRLRRRRRLHREELVAVAILVIALAATLVVLGLQWLGSGQSSSPGAAVSSRAISPPAYNIMGGHT